MTEQGGGAGHEVPPEERTRGGWLPLQADILAVPVSALAPARSAAFHASSNGLVANAHFGCCGNHGDCAHGT